MPPKPFLGALCKRQLAALSFSVGVVILVACGREGAAPESHEGERTRRTGQDLVSPAEHYVAAQSLGPKQLALTFDDGPGMRTPELSAYLKSENIRAVFFINGACVQSTGLTNNSCSTPTPNAPAILAQITADGHLVGNHTTTHRDMVLTVPSNQLVQELTETDAYITAYAKTPYNRSLFRAPFGSWSDAVYTTLAGTAMNHYVGPIYWDMGGLSDHYPNAAADWACFQGQLTDVNGNLVHSAAGDAATDGYLTTEECGNAYLNEINSVGRGIILMHDQYSWAQGSTVDMVKYLVPTLKKAGYTFVRVDEIPIVASDFPICSGNACVACTGSGADQCTSCAPGNHLSNGSCSPCTACPAGSFQQTACSATANTVCASCDPSCVTCTGSGADACSTCPENKYASRGTCKACIPCAAGSYAITACTATKNTECGPCSVCGSGQYASATCTTTTDTVCSACHPSCKECTGPGASDCAACPSAQYSSAGTCHPCTPCAAGSFASAACSATADTVCTTCGSCDDGDECTSDLCAKTGCTHAPIPGCTPSSPERPQAAAEAEPAPVAVAKNPTGSGCAMGPESRDGAPWIGVAFGVVALLRRRRAAVSSNRFNVKADSRCRGRPDPRP